MPELWSEPEKEFERAATMSNDSPEFNDPIIDLLESECGVDLSDNFVSHLASLSDVVKNDMRKFLEWDESVIHLKLHEIVASGLDKNGRYRERPLEVAGGGSQKFSVPYIDAQCLLTEWLAIYRTLRVYIHIHNRETAA